MPRPSANWGTTIDQKWAKNDVFKTGYRPLETLKHMAHVEHVLTR